MSFKYSYQSWVSNVRVIFKQSPGVTEVVSRQTKKLLLPQLPLMKLPEFLLRKIIFF
jgi:hypothetical protein